MEEPNANRRPNHSARRGRQHTETVRRLRKWFGRQGRNIPSEFLQGAAYKLGSGAVTLLILWWETRH
jgi:hypothetical protein